VALAGLALPVCGQESLQWKFQVGETFYIEAMTTTRQVLEIAGKTNNQSSTITSVSRFRAVNQDSEGTVLEQTIQGVKVHSDNPAAQAAARAANQARGATFRLTVTPAGRIMRFEGYRALLRQLTGGNEAMERDARNLFPEESLKEELHTFFGFLPEKGMSPGARWKRPETAPLGPLGSLSGESEFRWKGKGEKGEEITVSRTLKYAPPKNGQEGFRVLKGDLVIEPGMGTILFDSVAGRLVREELMLRLRGTLTVIDASRKTATFKVQQDTSRVIRLQEKNPLE
jgi:hypothetical protein